jgi:sorting nexin-41/42
MERVSRRALKRWSDSTQDHHELGAALNGFSLNESGTLSAALERTGQAVDVTYLSNAKLVSLFSAPIVFVSTNVPQVQELEQNWAEPLYEYSQFASIIKKLLAYRHQKHVQYEMTQDGLVSKREQLDELEKSEREAKRLELALSRGRASVGQSNSANAEGVEGSREVRDDGDIREGGESEDNAREEDVPGRMSASLPPHPGPRPTRHRLKPPGMGFLNALSYTLQGMMDVDPETARRNTITKTKESITSVC